MAGISERQPGAGSGPVQLTGREQESQSWISKEDLNPISLKTEPEHNTSDILI